MIQYIAQNINNSSLYFIETKIQPIVLFTFISGATKKNNAYSYGCITESYRETEERKRSLRMSKGGGYGMCLENVIRLLFI